MFTTIIVSALISSTVAILAAATGIVMYTRSCTEEERANMGIKI